MLLVVQFPISDARAFASTPTSRLDVPEWPDPQTYGNPQFVRRFGPAEERNLGPDAAWTDERVYCQARRAIRFPEMRSARLRAGNFTLAPRVAFRRLFCDRTTAVVRVELGFAGKLSIQADALGPTAVESAVRDLLALETDVFDPSRGTVRAGLIDQGQRLARLFAFASSRRRGSTATVQEQGLVRYGHPMVVAEFDQDEVVAFPKGSRNIDGVIPGDAEVAYFDRLPVPVWLLRRGTVAEPVLRSLRLCLLRLHAERECLDRVLAHVLYGRITYAAGTGVGDRLVQYLDDSTKLLEKQRTRGVQQSDLMATMTAALLEAMTAAEKASRPLETQAILDRITYVQRQIRVKVERYLVEHSGPKIGDGGIYMEKNDGVVITGGTQTGPIVGQVIASQISGSFNTVVNSGAGADIQAAMTQLSAAIEKLLPKVGESDQSTIADSVDILAKQAVKPKPDQDFVRTAGTKLIEIAKTVTELATPVATAVNAVLGVLKFAAIVF